MLFFWGLILFLVRISIVEPKRGCLLGGGEQIGSSCTLEGVL